MKIEKRFTETGVSATRRRLSGIAVPFNVETLVGGFRERVIPGAFAASLASARDVLALVDHNSGKVLARTRNGTLRLAEGPEGLAYELELPETPTADEVRGLAAAGSLGGVSIGFRVAPGGERRDVAGVRELLKLDLIEVSIITSFPAYPGTSTNLRAVSPRRERLARYLATL